MTESGLSRAHLYPRLAPHARLRPDPARHGVVVLVPEGVVRLNSTGLAILKRCDGEHSVERIVDELIDEYAGAPEEIREDVLELLQNLEHTAVVVTENRPPPGEGLDERRR
jgi:pyrroloquinoline quinone biosynthesis protein D